MRIIIFIFGLLFIPNLVWGAYVRTPADAEIPYGTTVNFKDDTFVSSFGDTYSYFLRIYPASGPNIDSACIDLGGPSGMFSYDVNFALLDIGEYLAIDLISDPSMPDCSDSTHFNEYDLESGSPAFEIIDAPAPEYPFLTKICVDDGIDTITCDYSGIIAYIPTLSFLILIFILAFYFTYIILKRVL